MKLSHLIIPANLIITGNHPIPKVSELFHNSLSHFHGINHIQHSNSWFIGKSFINSLADHVIWAVTWWRDVMAQMTWSPREFMKLFPINHSLTSVVYTIRQLEKHWSTLIWAKWSIDQCLDNHECTVVYIIGEICPIFLRKSQEYIFCIFYQTEQLKTSLDGGGEVWQMIIRCQLPI